MTTAFQPPILPEHADARILVCDDSVVDVSYLVRQLESLGYHSVAPLMASSRVMPLLESCGFDLILLDLTMPYPDGLQLIGLIRQLFSAAELPILVITAHDSKQCRNAALLAGANDFLVKSTDSVELSLRVRNLLANRFTHKANQAIRANLEHEVAARTARLNLLIENGLLMSMTRERSTLIRHTLFEGQRLLNCDAASMYLVTDQKTLRFVMRTRDDDIKSNEIALYDPASGQPNEHYAATYCALHRKSVLIDDVYQETRFDLSGTRSFDAHSGYRTVSMLTVPMAPRNGEAVGVLQFINKRDPATGQFIPFPPDLVPLVEVLAAHSAVTLDNLQLIEERQAFMESLIYTIATAIDAKSPFTGRHSERVPVLALMLAKEASAIKQGPLADFAFRTEDEWHEFRVGAWLHDCGKITTPEHIIDKATKLESIFNRIHEVRLRFEVLLRDADIERLHALANGDDAASCNAAFETRKAKLADDFAFIAQSNIGVEHMDQVAMARVRQIGQTRWLRHFDDRLGLSQEELARRQRQPVQALPVWEALLADQPHHLIERDNSNLPDPSFGFKVDVPHYLYNLGEIYNLNVMRGTLTEEERFKINEHMIHGIMMLERMPFPKSLQRVPEYAGTHHETLKGTGYPRKLGADALSIPARIMVIADIFEALTAADRPYKTPKKFSEAINILHSMKNRGLIDPDLFDLFLTSGVYEQYAKKFLIPEQLDDIDIKLYLGPVPLEDLATTAQS